MPNTRWRAQPHVLAIFYITLLAVPVMVVAGSGATGAETVVVMAYGYILFCSGIGALFMVYRRVRRQLRTQETRTRSYIRSKSEATFRNLESLSWLQRSITPRLPLPHTRGDWAVSPDFLQIVVEQIVARRPASIVELGSGVSSIYIGYVLESLGSGVLYSVDHDARYLSETEEVVRRHGLEARVRLVHAPLEELELDSRCWQWYRLEALDVDEVDLLIVDGPPAEARTDARFPGVPMLLGRLKEGAVILLDDYGRPGEREIVGRWLEQYPELHLDKEFETEQGTAMLTMRTRLSSHLRLGQAVDGLVGPGAAILADGGSP
jgi:predicted O-methyltransferase YrrM